MWRLVPVVALLSVFVLTGHARSGVRVPEDGLDWQARPKSHTIGWNANHLAEILGWVEGVLTAPSWDIAPAGGEPYQSPKLTSR